MFSSTLKDEGKGRKKGKGKKKGKGEEKRGEGKKKMPREGNRIFSKVLGKVFNSVMC